MNSKNVHELILSIGSMLVRLEDRDAAKEDEILDFLRDYMVSIRAFSQSIFRNEINESNFELLIQSSYLVNYKNIFIIYSLRDIYERALHKEDEVQRKLSKLLFYLGYALHNLSERKGGLDMYNKPLLVSNNELFDE